MNRESALNILVVGCCGVGKVSRSDREIEDQYAHSILSHYIDLLHKSTHKLGTLSPFQSQILQKLQSHAIRSWNGTPFPSPNSPFRCWLFPHRQAAPCISTSVTTSSEEIPICSNMIPRSTALSSCTMSIAQGHLPGCWWDIVRFPPYLTPHQTNHINNIANKLLFIFI